MVQMNDNTNSPHNIWFMIIENKLSNQDPR